jgi:hypothetical protein
MSANNELVFNELLEACKKIVDGWPRNHVPTDLINLLEGVIDKAEG